MIRDDVRPKRVQKGDGKLVVVFHTSKLGVKEKIADVDILVNGGEFQPGCQNELLNLACSHFAAFVLRELIIIKSNELPKNGRGIPIARGGLNNDDEFPLELTNPVFGKSGIYHITTGMIFETKTEGSFERIANYFTSSI